MGIDSSHAEFISMTESDPVPDESQNNRGDATK